MAWIVSWQLIDYILRLDLFINQVGTKLYGKTTWSKARGICMAKTMNHDWHLRWFSWKSKKRRFLYETVLYAVCFYFWNPLILVYLQIKKRLKYIFFMKPQWLQNEAEMRRRHCLKKENICGWKLHDKPLITILLIHIKYMKLKKTSQQSVTTSLSPRSSRLAAFVDVFSRRWWLKRPHKTDKLAWGLSRPHTDIWTAERESRRSVPNSAGGKKHTCQCNLIWLFWLTGIKYY